MLFTVLCLQIKSNKGVNNEKVSLYRIGLCQCIGTSERGSLYGGFQQQGTRLSFRSNIDVIQHEDQQ
ncbi:hypothetical protein FMO003_07020 [Moritella sp. F3]|nr:hypothetical protein FMO003_07020 [Moritella sp. F3]